jgi:isopenicillin-N epimerase
MEAEPVQFLWRHFEAHLEPARSALAKFLGARRQDCVFVTNATTGVNAVLRSLDLRSGDELLTTNHDYNACHNAITETARRARIRLKVARIPFPIAHEDEAVEAILREVTPRTRLALVDHVTSHTALVLPIQRIVRELAARGVDALVDGAHAPGMVPLDLSRLSPAYYAGNLHKWICAPKGAGFLWAREDRQPGLNPAVISHGNNTPRPGFTAFQDRFDWAGTFDPSPWFSVAAAMDWMSKVVPGGWRELRRRNHELTLAARKLLCKELAVEPPCPEGMLGSMATLPLPELLQGKPKSGRIDSEQLRLYDAFGIEVPFLRIGEPWRRYFRISCQVYNTVQEYRYLADSLRRLG